MTIDEPTGPSPDRSAKLAELAEQIQRITEQPPVAPPADRPRAGRRGSVGRGPRSEAGDSPVRSDPAPRSAPGADATVPGAAAPGHPEDEPGDPEAVARAICLRLLATAARPRAGLAAALARKGIPPDAAARVLDRLTEVGLIDDEAYAQSFVASRHRHGALGADALRDQLRRKGVDNRTAASAVAVVDRDAEYDRARAFLERRVDSAMAHGAETARRRLLGLLARRGYPADLAQRVVRDVMTAYGAEAQDDRF
jgi:regulatory protein